MRSAALAFSNNFVQPTSSPAIDSTNAGRAAFRADPWSNGKQWLGEAISKILALSDLSIGWDGYQGKPVSQGNVILAVEVLGRIAPLKGVPLPSIVPMSNGGIQFEWHRKDWDLEVAITAPNSIDVFAYDLTSQREQNFPVKSDLQQLLDLVTVIAD
jgi:hypothetical protein